MDSRRTFLHRSPCPREAGTRRRDTTGSARAPNGHGDWTPVGGRPRQIPAGARAEGRTEGREAVPEWSNARVVEKSSVVWRRPTVPQTDTGGLGVTLPRCSGDPLLRNSAKWPRTFGRRGAPPGGPAGPASWGGPQGMGPSDCLPKTPVSANAEADV